MASINDLSDDILHLLMEQYLDNHNWPTIFRLSKKFQKLSTKYEDLLSYVKLGWDYCICNSKLDACKFIFQLKKEKINSYVEVNKDDITYEIECNYYDGNNYNDGYNEEDDYYGPRHQICQGLCCKNANQNKKEFKFSNFDEYKQLHIAKELKFVTSFEAASVNGNTEVIKWLFDLHFERVLYIEKDALVDTNSFNLICHYGYLDMVKLFIENDLIYGIPPAEAFTFCCTNNYFECAQMILNFAREEKTFVIYFNDEIQRTFTTICKNGYLIMAKWFIQQEFDFKHIRNNTNIRETITDSVITECFLMACTDGDFPMAKWLNTFCVKFDFMTRTKIYNKAFYGSCTSASTQICDLINEQCKQQGIKIEKDNVLNIIYFHCAQNLDGIIWTANYCIDNGIEINIVDIISCCVEERYLEMARRLIILCDQKKYDIDLSHNNWKIFRWFCNVNNFEMVKWFYEYCENNGYKYFEYSRYHIIVNSNNNEAFKIACRNSNLNLVNWLVKTGLETNFPIDIHENDDAAFVNACLLQKFDLASLLVQIAKKNGSPIKKSLIKKYGIILKRGL